MTGQNIKHAMGKRRKHTMFQLVFSTGRLKNAREETTHEM
jgi:hypothetical protein